MSGYLFYPGCSLEKNARPYLDSLTAVMDVLGISAEEVADWNCCGATEYSSIRLLPAHALIARNLALAQRQAKDTHTLMAPCSACYLNLSKTDHYMQESAELSTKVNGALAAGGLSYTPGAVQVRHALDVLFNDVGLAAIREKVTRPLKGLRVAAYYGCLVTRPDYNKRFSSHEYPNELERIMQALGAQVIDFPLKTHCCGGHMTQISEASAYEIIRRLIHAASAYKADILVTLCPMCQLNLDVFQVEMNKFFKTSYHVPIVYFTQLMGLAYGKDPTELGFGKEFVDARPALARIGVELPAEPEAAGPREKRAALPMPQMPGGEEANQ